MSTAVPSALDPITAIRDPSDDQAGKLKVISGRPTGVTEPPLAAIVSRWPSVPTAASRGDPATRAATVARGAGSGGTVTTPRPEMKARKTIDTTSATMIVACTIRRPRPGLTGGSWRGSSNAAGSSMLATIREMAATGR